MVKSGSGIYVPTDPADRRGSDLEAMIGNDVEPVNADNNGGTAIFRQDS